MSSDNDSASESSAHDVASTVDVVHVGDGASVTSGARARVRSSVVGAGVGLVVVGTGGDWSGDGCGAEFVGRGVDIDGKNGDGSGIGGGGAEDAVDDELDSVPRLGMRSSRPVSLSASLAPSTQLVTRTSPSTGRLETMRFAGIVRE